MIGDALRWLANRVDPPAARGDYGRGLTVPINAFADAGLAALRREHALGLMDPDTLGYVAAVVKNKGGFATVEVESAIHDEQWPSVKHTLGHMLVQADRVYKP